jgi:16S rRNA (uracil1498-N3)-methyltransferase
MKNRFFFDGELAAGRQVQLDHEESHHARVLRVREGEHVEVFDGRGAAFEGTFEPPNAINVAATIESREPPAPIHLAMSIIHLEKFELVLQKATELGVASIIPVVSQRCEVRPERYRGKSERWQKILFEATKQSGRARVPLLETPAAFGDVVARPGAKVIFDAECGERASARESPTEAGAPHTLFIGPEGGWSEDELDLARRSGCSFQQLGPRRLRAETAAIVAVALASLRH